MNRKILGLGEKKHLYSPKITQDVRQSNFLPLCLVFLIIKKMRELSPLPVSENKINVVTKEKQQSVQRWWRNNFYFRNMYKFFQNWGILSKSKNLSIHPDFHWEECTSCLWSCEWVYIHVHIGRNNWTQWYLGKYKKTGSWEEGTVDGTDLGSVGRENAGS